MELYWLGVVFVLGAIIGSFLNVVICRLHTGKSLNNRSHCLSCSSVLHWYDLVPIFSYSILRGRCRSCGAWIPIRYLSVEVLTGFLFVCVFVTITDPVLVFLAWVLLSIFIVGGVYDLYHFIIPDEIVIASTIVTVLIVSYTAYSNADFSFILWSLFAGAIAFFCYAGLWYVSGGRWIGFGDAKLAVPLGMLVGITGVFSLIVLSFWIGAAVSLMIIAGQVLFTTYKQFNSYVLVKADSLSAVGAKNTYTTRVIEKSSKYLPTTNEKQGESLLSSCSSDVVAKNRRYFTMKSEIPFAPFLITAFVFVYLFHADVLSITLRILT